MLKATLGATLDKHEIKYREAGKKAKVTLLSRLNTNEDMSKLGIDPTEFLTPAANTKKKVFQNIPILTESFKIELWSSEEKESGHLASYTFEHVSLDKVEVNMEPLNGEDAEPEAIAKFVFTVNVDADLNHWLFLNLAEFVVIRFTQKAEQRKLDFDKEQEFFQEGERLKEEMSPEAQELSEELDHKLAA